MSIQLLKAQDQNTGTFDNGKIKERKPIAFPGENPVLQPFSTLFYWAYAWSNHGGLIAEHPHRGFEICTFVLDGSIEHYDSKNQAWLSLAAGDVQIIRSGNGITHAERLNPGGRIFHSRNLIALHRGLQSADRVDLGYQHTSALAAE